MGREMGSPSPLGIQVRGQDTQGKSCTQGSVSAVRMTHKGTRLSWPGASWALKLSPLSGQSPCPGVFSFLINVPISTTTHVSLVQIFVLGHRSQIFPVHSLPHSAYTSRAQDITEKSQGRNSITNWSRKQGGIPLPYGAQLSTPTPTSSWCRLLSCPLPVHLFTHLDLDLLGFPLALALLSHICSWLHLLSNPWLPTSSLQQLFLPLQLCGVYFHTNTDFIAFLSAYFWNFWDSAIASSLYLFL